MNVRRWLGYFWCSYLIMLEIIHMNNNAALTEHNMQPSLKQIRQTCGALLQWHQTGRWHQLSKTAGASMPQCNSEVAVAKQRASTKFEGDRACGELVMTLNVQVVPPVRNHICKHAPIQQTLCSGQAQCIHHVWSRGQTYEVLLWWIELASGTTCQKIMWEQAPLTQRNNFRWKRNIHQV